MIFLAGPGHGAPGVLGPGYLEGTYSEVYPDKSEDFARPARVLQAVLLPRRHRQPLHARNARLHPRRRRTRLRALARLRRGLRQPRTDRRRRCRRRRIRDRPARHLLAHQQVPQSRARRRGAADPPSQRIQDQQPDAAGAHPARRTGEPDARLRLDALFRRRLRPRQHAPGDGRHGRALRSRDQAHTKGSARRHVESPARTGP